jgi:hypothetical protein
VSAAARAYFIQPPRRSHAAAPGGSLSGPSRLVCRPNAAILLGTRRWIRACGGRAGRGRVGARHRGGVQRPSPHHSASEASTLPSTATQELQGTLGSETWVPGGHGEQYLGLGSEHAPTYRVITTPIPITVSFRDSIRQLYSGPTETRSRKGAVAIIGFYLNYAIMGLNMDMGNGGILRPGRIACIVALGAGFGSLIMGCSTETCACPTGADVIGLPDSLRGNVIAAESIDSACSAAYSTGSNEVILSVLSSGRGTCRIQLTLADGSLDQATVVYDSLAGCCQPVSTVVDGSAFEPLDGGGH